ncbi:hypothetical protein Mgra_00007557 [Meloidogyne graminicola]|uniref:Uncharacterized protein n=1 Tax=Meloidogyne graminicola TaxID=189291 RepID=A0A8S9ZIM0_9BILA|nr:hypothetical protein Mgra_00007557 [Meloidogyne graminicola]
MIKLTKQFGISEYTEEIPLVICRYHVRACHISIDYNKDKTKPENYIGGCGKDKTQLVGKNKCNKGCFVSFKDNDNFQKGCGECNDNIACKTCHKMLCNSNDFVNKFYFCYNNDGNWEECNENVKNCYYSIDKNGKEQKGCGECNNNKMPCKKCYKNLCNNEDFIKKFNFCYNNGGNWKQCKENVCYYAKGLDSLQSCLPSGTVKAQQGCGYCPNSIVPCKKCNKNLCNNDEFFESFHFCYGNNDKWKECNDEKVCYYAKGEDNKVYRGCGKKPKENVQFVSCNQNLCNTKELFDKAMFCLERKTSETKTIKMINECIKQCVNKGCGNCPSLSCKTCSEHLCNDGKNLKYYCNDFNEGKQKECETPECYVYKEIKDNKLSKIGGSCGKCLSNNIPCRTCNTLLCNNEEYFNKVYYCWTKENIVIECNIEKQKNICYYAVINDKTIEQGCGDKTDWEENNVLAVKCKENICNIKKLFDDSLFCLNKGIDDKEYTKKSVKQCNEECFVRRTKEGKCLF